MLDKICFVHQIHLITNSMVITEICGIHNQPTLLKDKKNRPGLIKIKITKDNSRNNSKIAETKSKSIPLKPIIFYTCPLTYLAWYMTVNKKWRE